MGTLVVYSEDSPAHRYTICLDQDSGSYFLIIDGKPYWENNHLFEGTLDSVNDKIRELRSAEDLKTF